MSDENYMELEDNIFTLTDESGTTYNFEFLGEVNYNGKDYIVALDEDQEGDEDEAFSPLVIEIADEDDDNVYLTVTDDDIVDAVFELFKEENADDFIFLE